MNLDDLPDRIGNVDQLEELLSRPSPAAITALGRVGGDLIILGVAGKMGPTLARMALRASQAAGIKRRVIGVSRFSDPSLQTQLNACGIQTIQGDLLDPAFVRSLPDAPNVIYMAGRKFGSTGNEPLTWVMNTDLAARMCQRFCHSRFVAFSTGNVYGLVPVEGGGAVETDPLRPVGEYAMSCLGRERIFEHFSRTCGIPTAILRLNYANELRYGVLVDLAQQVMDQAVVDVTMGHVNVIWQGDACAMALAALADAASPPLVLNIAGPERLAVRDVCTKLGDLLEKPVRFAGTEAKDALLSDGAEAMRRYGAPRVGADVMIRWIAAWIQRGGQTLDKPTHFQSRDGRF